MKKLMILAVVAVAAVASQAADVKWGCRNVYIPVAKDVTVSESGIQPSSGDKFAAGALAINLFWVDNSGVEHAILNPATESGGAWNLTTAGAMSATAITSLVLDDMNAQGTTYKPSYKFYATYTTKDGVYDYTGAATATAPIGNIASGGDITVTANFATAGSWNYTANAVPEPTSGLLLLLGVAGLALRRRRA